MSWIGNTPEEREAFWDGVHMGLVHALPLLAGAALGTVLGLLHHWCGR